MHVILLLTKWQSPLVYHDNMPVFLNNAGNHMVYMRKVMILMQYTEGTLEQPKSTIFVEKTNYFWHVIGSG